MIGEECLTSGEHISVIKSLNVINQNQAHSHQYFAQQSGETYDYISRIWLHTHTPALPRAVRCNRAQ